jgi:hypothetical protein
MADSKVATFGIKVKADTNADVAAMSVEELMASIKGAQDAVKSYGSSMAKLRGNSDEVKDASTRLKAAKEAERDAISRATLALGKQGLTLADVAKSQKTAADAAKKAKEAAEEAAKKQKTAADATKEAWASAALGVVAALAAIAAAVIGAGLALAKFALESADALRTQGLFREAATGSAENAAAFGHQIDALAKKIPTSREELNKLSVDMSRSLVSTRISGQGIVDTFNAVAQTSAAMGDSAGKALESIVERGKNLGRIGIGLNELQGTGLEFTDVAKELASNLKIGIGEAQMQLRMGRVKIDAGAAAIKQAVEKRFGAVNAKQMISLTTLETKFKDNLKNLTSGIDMSAILGPLAKLGELFSDNTVAGHALKGLFTDFGKALEKTFKVAGPIAEKFFYQIIIETLKLEIAFLKVKKWFDNTFGKNFIEGLDLAGASIDAVKVGMNLIGAGIATTAAIVLGLVAAFSILRLGFIEVVDGIQKFWASLAPGEGIAAKFADLGGRIVDGLIEGLKGAAGKLGDAVGWLADGIKVGFKAALGIHSPSVVFAGYGRMTAAGFSEGVDAGAPKANDSIERMVTPPSVSLPTNGRSQANGGPTSISVSLEFPNAKDGAGVAEALTDSDFRERFTRLLEEIARSAGAPIHGGST